MLTLTDQTMFHCACPEMIKGLINLSKIKGLTEELESLFE